MMLRYKLHINVFKTSHRSKLICKTLDYQRTRVELEYFDKFIRSCFLEEFAYCVGILSEIMVGNVFTPGRRTSHTFVSRHSSGK